MSYTVEVIYNQKPTFWPLQGGVPDPGASGIFLAYFQLACYLIIGLFT